VNIVTLELAGAAALGSAIPTVWYLRERARWIQRVRELDRQANVDFLTGLPNRRAVMRDLERGRWNGSWSLAILDADHFKALNDCFGHDAGDEALIHIAGAMRDGQFERLAVGRLGGDEFVMAVDHPPHIAAARIAAAVGSITFTSRHAGSLTVAVSVGIAANEPGLPLCDLISRADRALYEAKNSSRRSVVWRPSLISPDQSLVRT
jgi:diguanylate cyclase (GGDEF)-like protein